MNDIRKTAARQYGLFTTRQWLTSGQTRSQLHRAVQGGVIVSVSRGVLKVAGAPPSWEQDVMAACLAVNGVASHSTAARLWGFRQFESKQIDVTVRRWHTPQLKGVTVHRSLEFEAATVGKIPLTTRSHTLLALAATAPGRLEGALNGVVLHHRGELGRIDRLLHSVKNQPGQPELRQLVNQLLLGRAPTESALEDDLLALLRRYGLPEPVPQYPVDDVRIDWAYPDELLGIEVHGWIGHAEKADLQRNCTKSNVLSDWGMLYFTYDDVHTRPAYVAATVEAKLAQRAA